MPELESPQWATTVKPGDTLILSFDGPITDYRAAEIRKRFAELLPAVQVVIVAGVSSMAVQPADSELDRLRQVPELRRTPHV